MGKLSNGLSPEAVARIEEGLEQLAELDANVDMSMAHLFLGELYAKNSQDETANTHLEAAEASFKAMRMDYWLEETRRIRKNFE